MRAKIYNASKDRPIDEVDNAEIMEMFHGFSHQIPQEAESAISSGELDDNDRELTEEQSQEALFECLRKWGIELTDAEEIRIKDTYFKEQWDLVKDPKTGHMMMGDSVNLFRTVVKDISGTLNPDFIQPTP